MRQRVGTTAVRQGVEAVESRPEDDDPLGLRGQRAVYGCAQIATPEFRAWFGKSKVVDASGEALRVFRGERRSPGPTCFTLTRGRATPSFTPDPLAASVYVRHLDLCDWGAGSCVVPAYLSIQNPLDLTALGLPGSPGLVRFHDVYEEITRQVPVNLDADSVRGGLGCEDFAWALRSLQPQMERGDVRVDMRCNFSDFAEIAEWITGERASQDRAERVFRMIDLDAYALADAPGFVEMLKVAGYDGIRMMDAFVVGAEFYQGDMVRLMADGEEPSIETWRPFRQQQVKSALGNGGAFDPSKPDILA